MQRHDRPFATPAARLIRDLVHERTGIYHEDDRLELMMEKISDLIIERGFDSHLDYYYLLKYDPENTVDWSKLVDAITVRETFFWREIDQVHALVDVILPQHFAKSSEPFVLWSAACASGEEPLTMAMVLDTAGWLNRAPIVIHASDASESAIRSARQGLYRDRSFRSLPMELRDRYFQPCGGLWQVSPELHRHIRWRTANLSHQEEIDNLARAHAIFCRNVFIYFSDEAIRQTAKLFAERMYEPGYLFIGASESLLRLSSEFTLQEIHQAFVYVKAGRS